MTYTRVCHARPLFAVPARNSNSPRLQARQLRSHPETIDSHGLFSARDLPSARSLVEQFSGCFTARKGTHGGYFAGRRWKEFLHRSTRRKKEKERKRERKARGEQCSRELCRASQHHTRSSHRSDVRAVGSFVHIFKENRATRLSPPVVSFAFPPVSCLAAIYVCLDQLYRDVTYASA